MSQWVYNQDVNPVPFYVHNVHSSSTLSSMSDLPSGSKKHHNKAQALNYRMGIFESMQPVRTFFQWRGKPFLKHPGPHQPTILRHLFRNNYKPSTSAAPRNAQCFTPIHRIYHPLLCPQKSTKKTTENENKCWYNPFWFYSRMELLMQLCINLTLRHTNTHWVVGHECRNTHMHGTVAFFWTYHTLQLVGKLKAFLIQKLDVFWYSVNT